MTIDISKMTTEELRAHLELEEAKLTHIREDLERRDQEESKAREDARLTRIREGSALIAEKLKAAYALIEEAEKIADETGTIFSFDLAYGMGGSYHPPKKKGQDGESDDEDWSSSESGWMSSSSRC